MHNNQPTFESRVRDFVKSLKERAASQPEAIAYSAKEKKLSPDEVYCARLDTSLRDQGIVYANAEVGNLSVALSVRRFPKLEAAENRALVKFRVDANGAVCLVDLA